MTTTVLMESNGTIPFNEIPIGGSCVMNGALFIRIDTGYDAVEVKSGKLHKFHAESKACPVDIEIHVRRILK